MSTRFRLSPPALEGLARAVGDDGCITAAEVERVFADAGAQPLVLPSDDADEERTFRAFAEAQGFDAPEREASGWDPDEEEEYQRYTAAMHPALARELPS